MRKPAFLLGVAVVACLCVILDANRAQADDPPVRLMEESFSYLDVPDAIDGDDPIDFRLSIGFSRSRLAGDLQRELRDPSGGGDSSGRGRMSTVGEYEHIRNALDLGAELGLWHDLGLFFQMPLILSDTRRILRTGGTTENITLPFACDPADPACPEPLFGVPFDAPTRSGIDYIALGIQWGIFNQFRSPASPNWVLRVEGRFGIGTPMRACADGEDGCSPGISRGTNALRLETRFSRRYRHIEPYGSVATQIEWPGGGEKRFLPTGDLRGFMNTKPPILGEFVAGVAMIPWEQRARQQRFTIDLRAYATYVSEGREYSPLFDALGSSQSPYLTEPNCEGLPRPGTSDCTGTGEGLRQVEFTGLTDVQAHGIFGTRLGIEMQAAEYVRFGFGADVAYITPYFLTFADACNPDASSDSEQLRGACDVGIINPHHRPAIDLPGQRFRMDASWKVDFFATATAMF